MTITFPQSHQLFDRKQQYRVHTRILSKPLASKSLLDCLCSWPLSNPSCAPHWNSHLEPNCEFPIKLNLALLPMSHFQSSAEVVRNELDSVLRIGCIGGNRGASTARMEETHVWIKSLLQEISCGVKEWIWRLQLLHWSSQLNTQFRYNPNLRLQQAPPSHHAVWEHYWSHRWRR